MRAESILANLANCPPRPATGWAIGHDRIDRPSHLSQYVKLPTFREAPNTSLRQSYVWSRARGSIQAGIPSGPAAVFLNRFRRTGIWAESL